MKPIKGRYSDDPKTNVVKVRINDETRERLENIAKRKGKTISDIVRESISDYLRK